MFTFNTPCLRWKLLEALKYQYGVPGFAAPYATRYLSALVTLTEGVTDPGGFSNTVQQLFTIDRITGVTTPNTSPPALTPLFTFAYGQDLTGDPATVWTVKGDTYYSFTHTGEAAPPLGNLFATVSVQLSNPYTLEQLEADTDALLATMDPDKMAWNSLQFASHGDVGAGGPTFFDAAIPVRYNYFSFGGAIPELRAAAWNFLTLGTVTQANYFPNACCKLVSRIAMAGNYCRKIFTLDEAGDLTKEVCESGTGSCAQAFEVTPAALTAGENSYVLAVPNCKCGG